MTRRLNNKVGVWEAYAHKKDGSVIHFDIVVPADFNDEDKIFEFGQHYLKTVDQPDASLNATRCQFCHIEETSTEISEAIERRGFYILEMDDIPGELHSNPSKRDMILYLKANFEPHRFRDFTGIPFEEVKELLQKEKDNQQ